MVQFFLDAELQVETREQLREVKKALHDLRSLPVSTLRAKRYADYELEPDQWPLGALLKQYYLSANFTATDSLRFYQDSKKPAAQILLKKKLAEVEKAIEEAGASGFPVQTALSSSENLVVQFFLDAELQVETREQLREVKKALRDLRSLPVGTLRARRYANYALEPDQWPLGALLKHYYLSANFTDTDSLRFYQDSKKPAAQILLKKKLAEVE
ncbi:MAG: hypothetical protein LBS89_04275 [Zoogloeaceae bacterium]|nr:hypothetical protein [Zoogloeaceae bacterium]